MTCVRSVDITSKHLQPVANNISSILQNWVPSIHLLPSQVLRLEQQCSCDRGHKLPSICGHNGPRNGGGRAKRASDFQLQCRRYISSSSQRHKPKSVNAQKPPQSPLRPPPPPGRLSPRNFAPPPRPNLSLLYDPATFEDTIARTSDEIAQDIAQRDAKRIAKERERVLREKRAKEGLKRCYQIVETHNLFHIGANIDIRVFTRQELEKARNEARAFIKRSRASWQRKVENIRKEIEDSASTLQTIPDEIRITLKEARNEGKQQYRLQRRWEVHYENHLRPTTLRIERFAKYVQTLQQEFLDTKYDIEMHQWTAQKILLQTSAALHINNLLKDQVTGMHMPFRQMSDHLESGIADLRRRLEQYNSDMVSKCEQYPKQRISAWRISTAFSRIDDNTRSLVVMAHHWRNANLYRNIQARSPAVLSIDLLYNQTKILSDKLDDNTASVREQLNDFARLQQLKSGRIPLIQTEEHIRWQMKDTRYERVYKYIRRVMHDVKEMKMASRLMFADTLNFVPTYPFDRVLASIVRPIRQYIGVMHENAQMARDYCYRDDLPPSITKSSSFAELYRISGQWSYKDRRDFMKHTNSLQFATAAKFQLHPDLLVKADLRFAELRAAERQKLKALDPKSSSLATWKFQLATESQDLTSDLDKDDYGSHTEPTVRNLGGMEIDVLEFPSFRRIASKPSKTVIKSPKLLSKPSMVSSKPLKVVSKPSRTHSKSLRVTRNIAPERKSKGQTWTTDKLNPKRSKSERLVKKGSRSRKRGKFEADGQVAKARKDFGEMTEPTSKITKNFVSVRKLFRPD